MNIAADRRGRKYVLVIHQRTTGPRRARLERVAGRLAPQTLSARLARCSERLGVLDARARQAIVSRIAQQRRHVDACGKLLGSLGYHGVLQRGYALVRDSEGRTVRSAAVVAAGQQLDIELADGRVPAQALQGGTSVPTSGSPAVPTAAKRKPGGGQGSLF